MKSDEVRQRVLADHAELRERLDAIEALADRFERSDEAVGSELRERGLALYARFSAHLEIEERYLIPALRAASREGARRAERLHHEHDEQRELLRYLTGRISQQPSPTALIARELRSFAQYLRQDMGHEEQTLLDEALREEA
jgi:hemerythrin-like domain-containing protein